MKTQVVNARVAQFRAKATPLTVALLGVVLTQCSQNRAPGEQEALTINASANNALAKNLLQHIHIFRGVYPARTRAPVAKLHTAVVQPSPIFPAPQPTILHSAPMAAFRWFLLPRPTLRTPENHFDRKVSTVWASSFQKKPMA